MKKEYIKPEVDIFYFDTEDVITTSGDEYEVNPDPWELPIQP